MCVCVHEGVCMRGGCEHTAHATGHFIAAAVISKTLQSDNI